MQKNHTLKSLAAASAAGKDFSPNQVVDQLESVDELLTSLFMMAADLENDTHCSAFRRVIECAEEGLVYAVAALESDAARLRAAADEMRCAMGHSRRVVVRDEIRFAISDFRNGCVAFGEIDEADWDARGGENAVVAATYGGPLAVLEGWTKPASTREGAIDALRLAKEENHAHADSRVAKAMVAAALAFFEGEAG